MSYTPSNKLYLITISVLIIYLSIDFVKNASDSFFQLNYDWSNLQEIYQHKNILIDSISNNYVKFRFLSNNSKEPDISNTFCVKLNNKKYYYRCSNLYIEGHNRLLTGGFCIIGDSQVLWREAKNMRKILKEKIPDLVFEGNSKDLYGYPLTASINKKYIDVLEQIDEIPNTDNYVLFLGVHDFRTKIDTIERQLSTIINELVNKNDKCNIILTTLPKSKLEGRNVYNQKVNSIIKNYVGKKNITVIDLYNNFNIDFQTNYLMKDQLHMNSQGYKVFNSLLIEELK